MTARDDTVHDYTVHDDLKRRAAQFGRLALAAAFAALAGILLVVAFWMPAPGSPTAFRYIAIDPHMITWWGEHIGEVHYASRTSLMYSAMTLAVVVPGVGGLLSLCLRRSGLALALFGFTCLDIVVPQGMDRRGEPENYSEAARVTPGVAAGLDALAHTPVGPAFVFHQMQYPQAWKPGDPPVNWGSIDTFDVASVASELHYILAQRAYLAGNVEEARDELGAIDPDHISLSYASAYRVNVMRAWVAARGHAARGRDIVTPFPSIPVPWHRPLSSSGLAVAMLAGLLALGALALSVVVGRRARRVETYAVRPAMHSRVNIPA